MWFILRSKLLVYSAGSGVNGVKAVLLWFVQAKTWLYVFICCTPTCVCRCGGDAICVGHDLKRCSEWW